MPLNKETKPNLKYQQTNQANVYLQTIFLKLVYITKKIWL